MTTRRAGRALLAALLAVAGPALAQDAPTLEAARLAVDLTDDGSGPTVDATYAVTAAAGTDTISVRMMAFEGAHARAVEATVDGRPAELTPGEVRARGTVFLLEVPRSVPRDGPVDIRLRYRVDRPVAAGDGRFDMVVPLALPDAPPTGAPEDFFTADVRLPAGYAVTETFPTVPRDVETDADGTRHRIALQVAPAMLRWRGRIGGRPVVTFGRAVDLGTAGVVLLLAVLGYSALRRTARRDARAGRDRKSVV